MQTQDFEIIVTAIIGVLLGIWIGCKFMENIYRRDIDSLINNINELEKQLSK